MYRSLYAQNAYRSLQILSWLVDKTEMQDLKINIQFF